MTKYIGICLFFMLFASHHASADAVNWVDSKRLGEKAYFLHNSTPRIEIYDLSNEEWRSPLTLSQVPTAFHVDEEYIYVAFDQAVYRMDHDGANQTHLGNFTQSVYALFADADFVFVFYLGNVEVIDRMTAAKIGDAGSGFGLTYLRTGVSHSPDQRRFYGRSTGVSPSDIGILTYDAAGQILSANDSPHHGDYASATQTWPWPNGSKVVDSSGNVYDGASLNHLTSFATSIDDLAFRGPDIPIVLDDRTIRAYSNTVLQTGSSETGLPLQTIYTRESDIAGFYPDNDASNGMNVHFVAYDELNADEPGQPVDVTGLAFIPDDVFIDENDVIHMLSQTHTSIFRWDTTDQDWLTALPLLSGPDYFAYSPANDRIYTAYNDGRLFYLDMLAEEPLETPFANLPTAPQGMVAAGEYLVSSDQSGAWSSRTIWNEDGTQSDYKDWNSHLRNAVWNPVERIIHLGTTREPITVDGEFESTSSNTGSNESVTRVKPDGSRFLVSSGKIYNSTDGSELNTLPEVIKDATWVNGELFTLHDTAIKSWSLPTYAETRSHAFVGEELRLFTTSQNQLALLYLDPHGIPQISLYDDTFDLIPPAVIEAPTLQVVRHSSSAATFEWSNVSGEEQFLLERKTGTDGSWEVLATLGMDETRYTDGTIITGNTYFYRVKADNDGQESEYSNEVEVDLVYTSPDPTPIDPPDLTFTPDEVFIDNGHVLYLLSKSNESIFRWDVTNQEWWQTIPLRGSPDFMTYSDVNHAIYLAYNSGEIFEISLRRTSLVEVAFANLATAPRGLVAAGEYIIGADNSGAWESHTSFGPDGSKLDYKDWNYPLNAAVWNEANRRIYHFRDGTSPNDLLWSFVDEDGTLGTQKDSPYHSSSGIEYPIRVKPDGTIVVLGSGRIYDAQSLDQLNSLGSRIDDAVWLDGQLIALAEDVIYSYSDATYAPEAEILLRHKGLRLFAADNKYLVSLSQTDSDQLILDVFDRNFEIVAPATLARPAAFSAAVESENRVALSWRDVAGESGYRVERKDGDADSWESIGTTDFSVTEFEDSDVSLGETYHYRVIAFNDFLESEASASLAVAVSSPEAPTRFTATAAGGHDIELEWEPTNLASGYGLERREAGSDSWTSVKQMDKNEIHHSDSGLAPDTTYEYRLRAFNGLGDSEWVAAEATTDLVPPGTPFLNISQTTPFSVELSWSHDSLSAETVIERSQSGSAREQDGEWRELAVLPVPETSYIDDDVESMESYTYRVKSRNEAGESPYSTHRTVTVPELEPPDSPPISIPFPATPTSLEITWTPVIYADGYRLEYRPKGSSLWQELQIFRPGNTSYTHTGLITGTSYEYRLQAWNAAGASPHSTTSGTALELIALLRDDFDRRTDDRMWYRIQGAEATDWNQGSDTGNALWFEHGDGFAETMAVDLRSDGFLFFSLRTDNQPEDGSGDQAGFAYLRLQYSTDGQSWETFSNLSLSDTTFREWTDLVFTLPPGTRSATTRFRWSVTGSEAVDWALDNVKVRAEAPAPVPWVDYLQSSVLNSTTVFLTWPAPNPSGVETQVDPAGVYRFQVERRAANEDWKTVSIVKGESFPVFVDYSAPGGKTLFYRVKTLAPWASSLPSLATMVTTVSQLDEWRMMNFGTTDNSGSAADTTVDGSGIANIQRYAFGLDAGSDPTAYERGSGAEGMPTIWVDPATNRLNVAFLRRNPESNPEITYIVDFSTNLLDWESRTIPATVSDMRGNWQEVRFEQPPAFDETGTSFVRVRIVKP